MKPMTIARHKYTGELYKFIREKKGTTEKLNYYFTKVVNITAGLDQNNKMTIRCDEPLALGMLIVNIKDANNNLILSDAAWQISTIQPVLNAFNTIESYVMKAVKFTGTF